MMMPPPLAAELPLIAEIVTFAVERQTYRPPPERVSVFPLTVLCTKLTVSVWSEKKPLPPDARIPAPEGAMLLSIQLDVTWSLLSASMLLVTKIAPPWLTAELPESVLFEMFAVPKR